MSNTECRYLCSPDILAAPDSVKYTVRIDFSTVEGDVVRAGTPISRDGKIANDTTAFGILLRDTWRQSPITKICIDGLIDFALAQEHSGVVLTSEAKATLRNIRFVGDPEIVTGGGSGGGGVTHWDDLEGRPFGKEIEEIVLLDETSTEGLTLQKFFLAADDGTDNTYECYLLPVPSTFIYGGFAPRIVIFDGEEYECVKKAYNGGSSSSSIGSVFSLDGSVDDGNSPFAIIYQPMLAKVGLYVKDTSVPHTIKIYQQDVTITQLPEEFLPAHNHDLPEHTHNFDDLDNLPFYDVVESLMNVTRNFAKYQNGYKSGLDTISVNVGEEYTVKYDGSEYNCVAKADGDRVYLGNGTLVRYSATENNLGVEDTGEPFCVLITTEQTEGWTKTAGLHTIEITKVNRKLLDAKFLPKATAITDVTAAPTAEDFNALLAALRAAGYMTE